LGVEARGCRTDREFEIKITAQVAAPTVEYGGYSTPSCQN
jgi:hypothetical protein